MSSKTCHLRCSVGQSRLTVGVRYEYSSILRTDLAYANASKTPAAASARGICSLSPSWRAHCDMSHVVHITASCQDGATSCPTRLYMYAVLRNHMMPATIGFESETARAARERGQKDSIIPHLLGMLQVSTCSL